MPLRKKSCALRHSTTSVSDFIVTFVSNNRRNCMMEPVTQTKTAGGYVASVVTINYYNRDHPVKEIYKYA